MASTQTPGTDVRASHARVIAFFKNRNDAYHAVSQLREAGFSSSEIGLMTGSNDYEPTATTGSTTTAHDESFWQKVKDFFTGESHDTDYDYHEASSGLDWSDDRANYYYSGINAGGALVSVTGTRTDEARRILQSAGGDLRESGFKEFAGTGRTGVEGDRRIQLRGEILRAYKDRVQRGEVRLRKDVITENKNVEVPLTREELVIERTGVSGQQPARGEIGTDQEIRVPLSEERVRTEKQPVVTDEVRVGKRAVQRTENVSDNVRREELRVDKDGDVEVDTQGTPSSKRKKPAA